MESRKRGGRLKGTPNKITATIKQKLSEILNAEIEKLRLENLTSKDRIELVKALLPYILPKLQTTSFDIESPQNEINQIKIIEWTK